MKSRQIVMAIIMLLSGCAMSPKTEIAILNPKFSSDPGKKLGIAKFDAYTIKPIGTTQLGVIGALGLTSLQAGKDSMDNSIDEEGVALYRKAILLIKERFGADQVIGFADFASNPEPDTIALSRQIRNVRLWGSKAPTENEIIDCAQKHGLDYVLYGNTRGGIYEERKQLFISTDWRIYDAVGNEVVSIFTRSVDEKSSLPTATPSAVTDKLLELFNENTDRFFSAITNTPMTEKVQSSSSAAPSSRKEHGRARANESN